jgi:hypothetical protein
MADSPFSFLICGPTIYLLPSPSCQCRHRLCYYPFDDR